LATDLVDVTSDVTALDGEGFWAVVLPFDGPALCARFATVRPSPQWPGDRWRGPRADQWETSLDRAGFHDGVRSIRSSIAAGDVYQVNLTRVMSAPLPTRLPTGTTTDVAALGAALAVGNPAPFSAVVRIPSRGVHIASASPERFLSRRGRIVWSSPIKGTAATADGFTAKDRAENVMIVDLVRNDLGRVCEWGSVTVPSLLSVEAHPGLHHLVSTVEGRLRAGVGWADAIAATFPPGSVTGAPKLAALDQIARLEPRSRGVYCGAVGWVDATRDVGDLNVAIRTFWLEDDRLCFGTGGAITYDSSPEGEWAETELKARRLLQIAVGREPVRRPATTSR
jgi:para-aminobenzoate synthetase component 1